jgi:hypothetical protein
VYLDLTVNFLDLIPNDTTAKGKLKKNTILILCLGRSPRPTVAASTD